MGVGEWASGDSDKRHNGKTGAQVRGTYTPKSRPIFPLPQAAKANSARQPKSTDGAKYINGRVPGTRTHARAGFALLFYNVTHAHTRTMFRSRYRARSPPPPSQG